ncbi:MAG: hypothetical protein F6K62_05590 [Sphaerospermopsis sp. SIO1G2]|nr:hypothetical protein [Sphaerospermopsis sp. SIO1G2]
MHLFDVERLKSSFSVLSLLPVFDPLRQDFFSNPHIIGGQDAHPTQDTHPTRVS